MQQKQPSTGFVRDRMSEIFQWLQVTGHKLQDDWCRCC